ncbi:peptidase [soil metagenome]
MRFSRLTVLAVLLLILTAAPAAASGPGRADGAKAEHERVLRFWTPAKMAAAQPRDFVRSGNGFSPNARPPKPPGGGGGAGSAAVTGATWSKGGAVAESVGKVYFTMGGSSYQCSGTVAKDSRTNFSLVLTAGHCAYDETRGEFASNWIFIPAWGSAAVGFKGVDCTQYGATKYGCWTATALVVHNGYATAGGFNTQATVHDYAFAVVGAGGKGGSVPARLDAAVPAFDVSISGITKGSQAYAFGYPAAGKYKGNKLTYCAGTTIEDNYNSNLTWGLGCDMTGGSSGGPWLSEFSESTGVGKLSSLNSYGYSGVKNMYGPKFNSNTSAVYTAADSATSNTVVGP